MGWMVTTPQPCVNSVSSEPINSGGSVVISGTNFSPDPNDDVVKVGGHTARCISASTTKLVVQVPEDASGGACDVNVTVAGIDAGSGSINVSAVPYLKSLSPTWAAPPMQVTVYGQGFAPGISGNAVTVGGFQAQIVHAAPDSITFIVPGPCGDIEYGYYKKVVVIVNGVRARNTLNLAAWDL